MAGVPSGTRTADPAPSHPLLRRRGRVRVGVGVKLTRPQNLAAFPQVILCTISGERPASHARAGEAASGGILSSVRGLVASEPGLKWRQPQKISFILADRRCSIWQ